MAKPEVDSFDELRKKLEKPVKLSETEKKKIQEIFTDIDKLLIEERKRVLDMDQSDAYRYMEILLNKFVEAKLLFDKRIVGSLGEKVLSRESGPQVSRVHREQGDFRMIFDQLSPELQETGQRLLGCIKSALQFEADGVNPSELLCAECSPEAMQRCIQVEDPSVKDEMDKAGEEFHLATERTRRGV